MAVVFVWAPASITCLLLYFDISPPIWFIFLAGLMIKGQNIVQTIIFFSTPIVERNSSGFFFVVLRKPSRRSTRLESRFEYDDGPLEGVRLRPPVDSFGLQYSP